MNTRKNQLAINNFTDHKSKFDEALNQLSLLSKNNFGLDKETIRHCHCGEILYYTQTIQEINNEILLRIEQSKKSS